MRKLLVIAIFSFTLCLHAQYPTALLSVADTTVVFISPVHPGTIVLCEGDSCLIMIQDSSYDVGDNLHDVITDGSYVEIGGSHARLGAYIPEDSTIVQTIGTTPEFLGNEGDSKFVNILSSGHWSFDGDTLQYSDGHAMFLIGYDGAMSCNNNGITAHFSISINDVIQQQLSNATYLKTSGELFDIGGVSNLCSISNGDKIKILIWADGTTTATIDHFSIHAIQIR